MLAKFSVKKPLTVFVAVVLVIILGIVSFTKMVPDLLPSINLPYALVMTTYPGATPEKVESEITKPLEQAMASLENIDEISSVSSENVSQVILKFSEDANMDNVVSDIREKINGVSGSWDDTVSTPYILKINPDLLPVTVTAVNYAGKNNIQLTSFLNDELMSQLEGTTGVASVSMSGNVEQQINVILSQAKIDQLNAKIKKTIDGKFDDAESELEKSQQKITDGKSELDEKESDLDAAKDQLENGSKELAEKTSGAQGQLIDKKVTLETTKSEIKAQLQTAQTTLQELTAVETQLTQLQAQYDGAKENLGEINTEIDSYSKILEDYQKLKTENEALDKELSSVQAQLDEAIASGSDQELIKKLQAQANELQKEIDDNQVKIKAISDTLAKDGLTPDTLPAKIEELKNTADGINTVLNTISLALSALGASPEDFSGLIKEVQDNIGQTQAGIATLNSTLTQLDSGSKTVDEALAELNKQQLLGSMEISSGLSQVMAGQSALASAQTQLDSAQTQLDSAKDQMEDQKTAAYDSANIDITMSMINQILTAQNFSMPAGYVDDADGDQYLVRVGDEIADIDEMKNLVLFDTGKNSVGTIKLSDVADVFLTDNSAEVYAKINGQDGVLLTFSKQSNYATATVSENINKRFDELSQKYDGLSFTNLSDQGDYIDIVINSVLENLVLGAILAIIILLFFLKDIKPTLIIACSVPISLMAAIVLMYFSGVTLNVISLSGLAIGVGMLVDNSIVVIENIYRLRSQGESVLRASVYGAKQVTGAIVASTLTTVCVFLPIVFIEGLTRQLFTDLALTIAYSLLASLAVAITLVPAMSSGILRNVKERKHEIFDRFIRGYEKAARASLNHKWIVISVSIVLLVGSVWLVLQKGFIMMPAMSGTQISVTVTAPEGASFEELTNYSDTVMDRVMNIDDIETVGAMANTGGMMGMGGTAENSATLYAIIKDNASRKDSEISKEIVASCSDLDCTVSAEGSMDMSSYMSAMSGTGITMTIYGNDLDELMTQAQQVSDKLKSVDGIDTVESGIDDSTPEIRITVDKNKAMAKGLTVAQVYQAVAAELTTNTNSTEINIDGENIGTVVSKDKGTVLTADDIKNIDLTYKNSDGEEKQVKLSAIADITDSQSLDSIKRQNQKRYIQVTGSITDGYNVTNVTNAVEESFKNYDTPDSISIDIGGESTMIMDSVEQLMYMLLLAVIIIYLIMVAQFQTFKSPLIVMFTIPLAFTGGFIALLMTGKELSVVSIVGFVMLSGIIVNNGIVLIDYVNKLRLAGMEKREAIILAGKTRMRPILMTALTTVLGLVFMAVGTGTGSELMQPMAIVCIGGLLYATLMTLFVIPAMYDLFNRKDMKKIIIDAEDEEEMII